MGIPGRAPPYVHHRLHIMPRDFLAENRSAALDFARKRREKTEAATAARAARKTAEAEALKTQEAYMAEVDAYHEKARQRGVNYGDDGGDGGDGGQPAERAAPAREPEPASWDDVPIGAAIKPPRQRNQPAPRESHSQPSARGAWPPMAL